MVVYYGGGRIIGVIQIFAARGFVADDGQIFF